MTATFESIDLASIPDFAQMLCECFPSQLAVGLVGTLGAGKTTLVQAIAQAFRIDVADVTSPTFTLLQSHQGVARTATDSQQADSQQTDPPDNSSSNSPEQASVTQVLHHLDAYRVSDEEEFLQLGVDELFDQPDAWTLVEWADRVESVMPHSTLWLEIQIAGDDDARSIQMTTTDPELNSKIQQMLARWVSRGESS